MQRTSAWRSFGWRVRIALVAVVVAGTEVRAGPDAADAPDAIFAAAREAVARGRTEKTALAGFDAGRAAVSDDAPEGGILVGFEVGLGDSFGKPAIYALRPLYLTPAGVYPAQTFGLPRGRRGAGKNGPKSKVTRTVTVQARAGYAIGEIAIDSGLNIDGIAVTFMRIRGTALDPKQSYTEDWVGTHEDKRPKVLSGGGDPIVGVFARQDEVRVMAVGLVRMRPAAPAVPAPVPPPDQKAATRPAPPPRPPEPEPEPEADPPVRPAGKALPPPQPPAAEGPPDPAPEKAARPPAKPAQDSGGFPWLPLAVFGAVSVPLFLGLMVVLRRKEPKRRRPEEADAEPAAPGAANSADLCESPRGRRGPHGSENTDICESPGPARQRQRPGDEPADALPADGEVELLPPYFEARAVFNFRPNRLFRVYVLPDRLLFLDVEPQGAGAHLAWMVPLVAVGMLFGLIGGLIAWYLLKSLAPRSVPNGRDLDDLDADELIARARYSQGCFQAAPGELSEVRLEPPSFWHSLWWAGSRYAGVVYLRHCERGRYTLQVLGLEDMKLAAEMLPELLGRRMEVNAVFSRRLWQFVRR